MSTSAIAYTIDAGTRTVRLEYRADAGFDVWAATLEAVLADPAYGVGFGFLVDRRRAQAPTTSELQQMVAFIAKHMVHFEGSHWAIVAGGAADFGMGRMGQALADDHPTTIQVFLDPEEAHRWLLDVAEAAPASGP